MLMATIIAVIVVGCGSKDNPQVTYLSHNVVAYSNLVAEIRSEKAIRERQFDALQIERALATNQIKILQDRNSSLTNRLSELRGENTTLNDQSGALQAEKTGTTIKMGALQNENAALKDQVGKLQTEKTALEKRAATLQAENTDLKSRLSALSAKPTNAAPTQAARTNVAVTSAGMQFHLIPNATTSGNGTWFNANSMPGGVPSLLVNEMNEVVTIHMQQVAGPYTIVTDLARGTNILKLAPGQYVYTSELKDGSTKGPDQFTVDSGPAYHFFKGVYHNGGVDIRPEKK